MTAVELAASQLGACTGLVDFDGDAILDQLVGAPHARRQGQLGVVFVHAGRGKGWSEAPSTVLTGDREFGSTVADVGDVDGDGRRDFAIGAIHGDSNSAALSGSVHVFAGASSGQVLKKLGGTVPASKFGWAIAGGDFNGDGAADVAVGSPFHTPEPALYQQGAVFVHFGPKLDEAQTLAAKNAVKGLGWSVAAGDLNGDGKDDLALSSSSNKVLVFFGRAEFKPALEAPDLTLSSTASGFGKVLAIVEDMDGDGRRELAIGAPNAVVAGRRDAGSVFIVRAQAPASIDLDASAAPAQLLARLDGPELFSRFGAAIASLRGLPGDETVRLFVGAPMADDQPDDMVGKVFMFASSDLVAGKRDMAKAFAGIETFGGFGSALAASADGVLLVGAPRVRADTGKLHLVDVRTGVEASLPAGGADASIPEGEHDHH